MSYYDDKPKNDFEKPKFDPYTPPERERGGCLSAFLTVFIALQVIAFLYLCSQTSRLSSYSSNSSVMPIMLVVFVVECITIACAVAVWNWQKWGYYGLVILYGLSIVLNLCSGNFAGVVGSVIVLAILFGLVNEKIEQFD
jgi:hypothetical protein